MASDDPDRACASTPVRASTGPMLDLWHKPAQRLTTWADLSGAGANGLLSLAAVAATIAFVMLWTGHYALGILAALVFIPTEQAGQGERGHRPSLAGTAVPILWWWAWWHGLGAQGRPLAPVFGLMVLWTAVGASAVDAAIQWLFERRSGGLPLSRWQRFDSRFDLVAASPTVNLALLAAGAVTRRPAAALVVAAWWTIATVIIHAVRLAQASEQAARGQPISPWTAR